MFERMGNRHGSSPVGKNHVYSQSVPASAYAAASEIRRQLPTVPTKKLHKLLYFGQGLHLAWFSQPLFSDSISAWDMGPVVGKLWKSEKDGQLPLAADELDEARRNTIAYVISRYGGLTGRDLEILTHAQDPWQRADRGREARTSRRIEEAWLREWFRRELDADDDPTLSIDAQRRGDLLEAATARRRAEIANDDLDELRARLRS